MPPDTSRDVDGYESTRLFVFWRISLSATANHPSPFRRPDHVRGTEVRAFLDLIGVRCRLEVALCCRAEALGLMLTLVNPSVTTSFTSQVAMFPPTP